MRNSILTDRLFSRHAAIVSGLRRAAFAIAVAATLAIPFAPAVAQTPAVAAHNATHQVAVRPYLPCPGTGSSC
ncbi:MAG TPA: hypothetical protein VKT52_09035 [Ktedonobacterales bacterium]|nr:hypothetical protein [Ktedonobacterales bacterium]